MNTERPTLIVVTKNGGYNKDRIFQSALPGWTVSRKEPMFDESLIQPIAPNDETRPVFISEAKAAMDWVVIAAMCGMAESIAREAQKVTIPNGVMYLYTDSVQFIHEPDGSLTIHEKPHGDPVVWASTHPDALAQSGKTVEIVSALTGIRCDKDGVSDPQTVIVRAKATMRPFTREELVAYAQGSGNKAIPDTAGGISLANGGRVFYDTSKPLTISVQDGLGSEPKELLRYETWAHVPDEALRPFICGAFAPAITRLVEKTRTLSMPFALPSAIQTSAAAV